MRIIVLLAILLFSSKISAQNTASENLLILELLQNQRYDEAAETLKKTYPEPISDVRILSRIGYSLRMAGKLSEAENYYLRILEQDPAEISSLFSMAGISQRKGNFLKAKEYYKQILASDSTNFSVYKQLSDMIESSEGLVFATPYLHKANSLNSSDGDIAYSYSKVLKDMKQFESAAKVLDKAIQADSTNLILLRGKAELAYAMKDWNGVLEICTEIIKGGDRSANILKMLGEAYYSIGKYQQAIDILEGMEANDMKTESTLYFIAMSYKALKNYNKSVDYLNKTIKESISPNTAGYYAQKGDVLEKSQLNRQSLEAYQKSLFFDSKPLTLYTIAIIYDQKLKQPKAALSYYRSYINSKPPAEQKAYIEYCNYRISQLSK
ncbi:MAG: CDC27 family protein [Daejeonella sp.]|uniref:tetratricopeptide repeat protein n=1 Tax=Daejeonella sp. TaxID=2805397 RepID=UPI002735CEF8|nr:CDC27 family protein [Daejeonella sp.]MDP3468899.1 CDC27 family protein [Daejeonella sp.]